MFDRNLRQSVLIKFSRTPGSSSCFASLVCAYIWWRSQASLPMRREVHITNVSTRLIETRSSKQGGWGGGGRQQYVCNCLVHYTREDREDKRDIIATCFNVRVVDLCRQSFSFLLFPERRFSNHSRKQNFIPALFLPSFLKETELDIFCQYYSYSTLLLNSWNSIRGHSIFDTLSMNY
jgi:hypothetical protein